MDKPWVIAEALAARSRHVHMKNDHAASDGINKMQYRSGPRFCWQFAMLVGTNNDGIGFSDGVGMGGIYIFDLWTVQFLEKGNNGYATQFF